MSIKQLRTPNPELPHDAFLRRCVVRAKFMRRAFFRINDLRRTHRADPLPEFERRTAPECVSLSERRPEPDARLFSCVSEAQSVRQEFFRFNNLHRTHRATPKPAFSTTFSPLATPGSGSGKTRPDR